MSNSICAGESVFQFPRSQATEHYPIDHQRYDALAAELKESLRTRICVAKGR